MPRNRSPKAPILVKSKSDMSNTRTVKFSLPTSKMSSPTAQRRKSTSPPKPGYTSDAESKPKTTSAGRRGSSSKSPPRAAGERGRSGTQQQLSPGRKGRHSLSPANKAGGGGAGSRKASASPTRTTSGKSRQSSTKGRTSSKEGSAKDDKKKKSAKPKTPDLTPSGLKIVDWSGQGMTNIPSNLLTSKDVGHLILASNNLRSLPVEIKRMKTLERLDLSRNGIRCTNSNDMSGLPQEMEQLVNLTELNISECNLPFVPPAIFRITSLRIVDLSRNKVNILLPEIGQLVNLVRLNMQQTNITSLPPEIAYCQEMEEIFLWGNSIETLPETLPEMPKLRVLALNYRSFCGVVDPYMENLLKKGQIKSEHIPVVVFELPALESLDLESTKLNSLPEIYNIQLQELCLSRNFLQTIPPSIYNLKYLHTLNMSNNLLITLPEDIGRLVGLRTLRLAGNSFERVPPTIGHLVNLQELNMARNRIRRIPPEIKGLKALKILILEKNNIQSLPEEICELSQLQTLDLTGNEVRNLPLAMHRLTQLTEAHSFHKLEKCGLWLYKNPLEQPPPEIWRTEKPDNIFDYLKKLMIIKTENLQRQKIQVIGDTQAGKTSLVNALASGKSILTAGEIDKTRLLNQTTWKTENNVDFVLNDFGGDDAYTILTKILMDAKALVLLVYDASTFSDKTFYTAIGQWLDMLSVNLPGAVVKIVGTKSDLLLPDKLDDDDVKTIMSADNEIKFLYPSSEDSRDVLDMEEVFQDLPTHDDNAVLRNTSTPAVPEPAHNELAQELVTKHLQRKEADVKKELEVVRKEMSKMEKPNSELNDMEEAALKMLQIRQKKLEDILKHQLKVLPEVNSVSGTNSMEGILALIDELEHLAIDQTLFPHAQKLIPGHWNRLRAMLKQRKGYYIYWEDVRQTALLFSIRGDELQQCIQYLHDTADLLWFNEIDGLSEIIFHKPRTLIETLSCLYRHDIGDFLQYENMVFLSKGRLSREQFQEASEIFIHNGEISRPLLNCLWFDMGFSNADISELLELLPLFEICFAVPEPNVPEGPLYNRPLMVLPWYNKDRDLESIRLLWPEKTTDKELSVVYSFPFFFPPNIFPNLLSQIQEFVDERMDCKDTIYASSETEKLLIQRSKDKDEIDTVTISVRGSDFTEVQCLSREMVEVINTQLLRFPGLYWKLSIPRGRGAVKILSKEQIAGSRRTSRLRSSVKN